MVLVPCFLKGTLISTSHGKIRVENLKIGDEVLSSGNKKVIVKFLGKRRLEKTGLKWSADNEPVIIKQNAFGKNKPERDLIVSPEHAVYLDGLFFTAEELVDDRNVLRMGETPVNEIEYFHIDLGFHDLVFAEGMATESFGGSSREHFDNYQEFCELYGSIAAKLYEPFAPWGYSYKRKIARLGAFVGGILPKSVRKLGKPLAHNLYDRAHLVELTNSRAKPGSQSNVNGL